MSAARKIIEAGFELAEDDGKLIIWPSDRLTDEQRRFIRDHKDEIIAELKSATVYDLDRHAAEKDAAIKYWRFRHNGIEVDFASGATLTEAYDLLRCEPDDELEPMIEYNNEDEDGTGAN